MLVHGGAAHSGWWDHIAPQLHSHRVVALDLTGHGDSGRRDAYDMKLWAREVVAVAEAEELDRPVVLGHSLGGWVALTVGVESPEAVAAVAVIDSPIDRQPPEDERLRDRQRPHRPYPTAEEAMAHFRTIPAQDVLLPYVLEHIARGSLRHDSDGWRWKFDPNFWGTRPLLTQLLPQLTGPSRCSAARRAWSARRWRPRWPAWSPGTSRWSTSRTPGTTRCSTGRCPW